MSNSQALTPVSSDQSMQLDDDTLEKLVVAGDLSKLNTQQRLMYYRARCEAAGLDYRTSPFKYLQLQGRLVLYADKVASDQLQAIHGARVKVLSRETENDIHSVLVSVELRDGRATEDEGCVSIKGLSGDALCNARLKAVTKAKRRAILSICGLGMLDETELETIPNSGKRAWSEPPRTLDALVDQRPQPATPLVVDPAALDTEPVQVVTYSGIPCVLGAPWEEWAEERIGGANRNLCDLQWQDLVTSQDPLVANACQKGLDAARKKFAETGQPPEQRYMRLAMAWAARERAALSREAEEVM